MPIALYRGISDRRSDGDRHLPAHRPAETQRGHPTLDLPVSVGAIRTADRSRRRPADNPIARGAYIAGPLAHCIECHTPLLSVVQRDWSRTGAGGMPIEGPWGIVVAPNITPDKEHGIGDWTDQQIRDALTKGVTPDGRKLLPPMGARAPVYSRITENDMRDLIAYLRSLPPE